MNGHLSINSTVAIKNGTGVGRVAGSVAEAAGR